MQFEKGQSGNPAGRPRGSRNKATLLMQRLMEDHAEAIARTAIEMAKLGDIAAIRLCMDRLAPARRSDPVVCELPPLDNAADSVAAVGTIVAAVSAGELTPSEAVDMAKLVDIHVRALTARAFEERRLAGAETHGGASRLPQTCAAIVDRSTGDGSSG